jgi:Fur family peroxide stress response transcriptional regulator
MKFGIEKFRFKSDLKDNINFNDYCHQHGLIATHQRMAVFCELAGTNEHPDAESIYKHVKPKLPSISLDTIYRTLRTFEEKGMVSKVTTVSERARFDADTSDHPHFVCLKCGSVTDIDKLNIAEIIPAKEITGFGSVSSVCLEIRGTCSECSKKKVND